MARKSQRKRTSRSDSRRSNRSYDTRPRSYSRKSEDEARAERITWALLVFIFGILYLFPDTAGLPNWFIPVTGAMILLGSGLYQYTRRWHVSPITWLAGATMFAIGFYGLYIDPTQDLLPFSLFVFAAVIAIGVLTGET